MSGNKLLRAGPVDRLLGAVAAGDARIDRSGDKPILVVLTAAGLRRSGLDETALGALLRDDLVRLDGMRLTPTVAGRARLARTRRPHLGFRAQHGDVVAVGPGTVDEVMEPVDASRGHGDAETVVAKAPGGATAVAGFAASRRSRAASRSRRSEDPARTVSAAIVHIDLAESPLGWLARRGHLAAAELQAGERLRGDFTRARMMPTITSNWSEGRVAGGKGGAGGFADLTDAALAARDRVSRAIEAVGPDLGDALVDVCCHLKGLETVEKERGWPPRCAKVIVRMALTRLAAHYGLGEAAQGRGRVGMRAWGAPDFRPRIGGDPGA